MHSKKIMIVEDDLIASAYLEKLLNKHDFTVCHKADNAEDALQLCKDEMPTLILMDIMIKGPLSGCDLAMQIRAFNENVIIIFLTAYSNDEMIESALDAKAYSYLLKPYRDIEIVSTIKMAIKERKQPLKDAIVVCKNGYVFDTKEEKLFYNNKEVLLSEKLRQLVKVLVKNKGSSLSYEQLSASVWESSQNVNINTLRALVHRLKTQLPGIDIHKVNKIGYVLY